MSAPCKISSSTLRCILHVSVLYDRVMADYAALEGLIFSHFLRCHLQQEIII